MVAPSSARSREIPTRWHPDWWPRVVDLADPLMMATRRMWRNRTVTLLILLSLSVGVGVNTAIFTLIDAIFLEPFPFAEAHRIGAVITTDTHNPGLLGISHPNYADLKSQLKAFESMAACTGASINLKWKGEVNEVAAEIVTPEYFQVLGLKPHLGRFFHDLHDRPEGERPAVLSFSLWRTRFSSDPGVIGQKVALNKQEYEIVGVASESYKGIERLYPTQIWTPISRASDLIGRPAWLDARRALLFQAFGRLKPGQSYEQADRELAEAGAQLSRKYPVENSGRSFQAIPIGKTAITKEFHEKLLRAAALLMTGSLIVLLIAIANVGNVLLARSSGRRREMAVRLALGATRHQVLGQLVLETILLVIVGGGLGMLLGMAGKELLWRLRPENMWIRDLTLSFNGRVLGFAVALSLVTGILASLVPVIETLRGNLTGELRERSDLVARLTRRLRFREILVISQVALSLVALVGADLFLKSLRNAKQNDPGFDTRHLALVEVNPRKLGVTGMVNQAKFYLRLQRHLAKLEGARSVTISSDPVFGDRHFARTLRLEGEDRAKPAQFVPVTSIATRYFETTDILILRGRDITDADTYDNELVAIVNEAAARKFWPNEPALGKKFRLFGDHSLRVVVGVARDTSYREIGSAVDPLIYTPIMQEPTPLATVHVRTNGDPAALSSQLAAAIRQFEPDLPTPEVLSISQVLDLALWAPRVAAVLLTAFGLLAMLLAAIGVYGLTAHLVRQRTGEIGVRMAMGACPLDVMELILRQAVTLILPGLAIGALASFALARVFQNLLYGVRETDLEPYLVGSVLLATVALLASYLPARRALKMEPVVALRQE